MIEVFLGVLAALYADRALRRFYRFISDVAYHHGRRGEAARWRIRQTIAPVVGWKNW